MLYAPFFSIGDDVPKQVAVITKYLGKIVLIPGKTKKSDAEDEWFGVLLASTGI